MRVFKNYCVRGFTLVELLVVIAIIAILFAVILIAINPAQRFKDSRNSRRLSDVKSIVEAATTYTADRRGAQLPDVPDYQCVGSKPAQDFQTTAPSGSTAFWRMDEASGLLTDSAGTVNNLTASNITYEASGKSNKAIQLDGATSSLSTPDNDDLDTTSPPGTTALTLEGWIKLSQKIESGTFDHHLPVFDKGNYRLQLNSESGKLEFDIRNPSGSSIEYDSSSADNTIKGVNALTLYSNTLYAGAVTTTNEGRILKKDGSIWNIISDYPAGSESVNTLAVYNGKLYGGQSSSDNSAIVYSFDGSSWVDTGLNVADSSVLALARYKGKLYAGIGIEPPNTGGGSIWEYDGLSWRSSKDFAASDALAVYSFSVFQGKLYAGTGRSATNNDARIYEFNENLWTQKLLTSELGSKDAVYSLAVFNKELYIGLGGNANTDGVVYKWNGTIASQVGALSTPSKPRVLALVAYGNIINAAWSGSLSSDGVVYYYGSGTWTARTSVAPATEVKALNNYYGKLYAATRGDTIDEAKIHTFGNYGFVESQKSAWYPNIWYHVAAIYSGSASMSIIINGRINNSITSSIQANIDGNSVPLYVGAGRSGDPFSGTLDNFAIYNNTALSADEVASHAGCYNLGQYLAPEYMGSLPIDPSSEVTDGTDTGYFISKDTGGVITITAPLTETTSSIPEIIKASR